MSILINKMQEGDKEKDGVEGYGGQNSYWRKSCWTRAEQSDRMKIIDRIKRWWLLLTIDKEIVSHRYVEDLWKDSRLPDKPARPMMDVAAFAEKAKRERLWCDS